MPGLSAEWPSASDGARWFVEVSGSLHVPPRENLEVLEQGFWHKALAIYKHANDHSGGPCSMHSTEFQNLGHMSAPAYRLLGLQVARMIQNSRRTPPLFDSPQTLLQRSRSPQRPRQNPRPAPPGTSSAASSSENSAPAQCPLGRRRDQGFLLRRREGLRGGEEYLWLGIGGGYRSSLTISLSSPPVTAGLNPHP